MSPDQWNVIIVVATLLAGGFAFLVYWRQNKRNEKRLTYDWYAAALTHLPKALSGPIQITFRGMPVWDVSMITITIRNAGAGPIHKQDFASPLVFTVGCDLLLLATVAMRNPPDVDASLTKDFDQAKLEIAPLLLNGGDEFSIIAMTSGFKEKIEVGGRISGVKSIQWETRSPPNAILNPFVLLTIFITLVGGFLLLRLNKHDAIGEALGAGVLLLFALFVTYFRLKSDLRGGRR